MIFVRVLALVFFALIGEFNSWTKPHVLRYATSEDISTLNPLMSDSATLAYLSSLTGALLVRWDANNQPYPELATEIPTQSNGGVSADGRTVTYHLRPGLKWSDGAPLTADDVVWTYHAIMNPANNIASTTGWDLVQNVTAPNKTTVVLHFRSPYSPFIARFFSSADNSAILPKHILAKEPNINAVPFNSLPIGAGPFKYKEWNRSQNVTMVPNPYYFRGMPKLKEVVFEVIPNRDTIFTQLATHELDLWVHVSGPYLARVSELRGYVERHQEAYQWAHIDFNTTSRVVSDPVVRHALELATDRATIIAKFLHGYGHLQEGIAPKSAPYFDASQTTEPFDIARANALLDRDGWKRGTDGIRERDGVKLDVTFALPIGSPNVESQLEFIRSTWQQIGVSITIHKYATPQLFGSYADGGILYTGKFDAILYNTFANPVGDFSALYGCDQLPPAGQNDLHWCNHKADAAMHALFSHFDQSQRNADDRILFRELAADRPQITYVGGVEGYIFNSDLKNFEPNGISPFDSTFKVDI